MALPLHNLIDSLPCTKYNMTPTNNRNASEMECDLLEQFPSTPNLSADFIFDKSQADPCTGAQTVLTSTNDWANLARMYGQGATKILAYYIV